MYPTNTYCMLQKDCTGKKPVLSMYIDPVCRSATAVKQNMSWAEHNSSVGWRQLTSVRA